MINRSGHFIENNIFGGLVSALPALELNTRQGQTESYTISTLQG